MVVATSLCGLGNSAPNPVLTALRYFRDEFEAHIIDKKCPAAVCQALFRAPCQHTCPVELDVPGYIALIKDGKFEDAYNLIRQRLPFPSICGRICHHPCEAKCRRGQVDDPLAIKHLKRFVTDWALEHDVEYTPQLKGGKKEKIAIIGAGPAGLSAAYDLTREGYQVTVFESLPIAGGMVMVGVPRYRLAKELVEKEIEAIEKMGVVIKLNSKIEDVNALFDEGYNAVFIATGAHKGLRLNIPGEDLDSVYQCVELLRRINLGEEVKLGKKVIVVGGGNVAMDAARSALRLGSEVKIVCLESSKEMPAWEWEVDETLEEGISIIHSRGPRRILSTDGKVSGLEVMEVRTVFDDEGRFNPTFYEDKISVIEGDTIILAIGQSPDTSFIKEGNGIELARRGWIIADPRTLATKKKGVFAGGDVVTGPKSVVEAVAAGQRAACSIKRYLESEELAPRVEREDERTFEIPLLVEEVEEQSRVTVSNVDPSRRKSSFCEVTLGYTEEQAREEAGRCLRCDLEV
jgi:NADH-quinone oxidoreductase subunit F